jgi:hypothetical protein
MFLIDLRRLSSALGLAIGQRVAGDAVRAKYGADAER